MVYAQILNGIINNIIELDDNTLIPLFSQGFDFCIQIDNLTTIPQIGWYYDTTSLTFSAPLTLALIQNNLVENIVQNSNSYLINNPDGYQAIVNITNSSSPPVIGYIYNSNGSFTPPQSYYQNIVSAAIAFGNQIILQYAAQNVSMGITQAGQTIPVMNYLSQLSLCLSSGSLYAAISQIETMIADTSSTKTALSPFVTNDILYTYMNLIQNYLGIPITSPSN